MLDDQHLELRSLAAVDKGRLVLGDILVRERCDLLFWFFIIGISLLVLLPVLPRCTGHLGSRSPSVAVSMSGGYVGSWRARCNAKWRVDRRGTKTASDYLEAVVPGRERWSDGLQ